MTYVHREMKYSLVQLVFLLTITSLYQLTCAVYRTQRANVNGINSEITRYMVSAKRTPFHREVWRQTETYFGCEVLVTVTIKNKSLLSCNIA
jgi:hypothetical protein